MKQILFASLIASHAAVVLCGPYLHQFAGSSHALGVISKDHHPNAPSRPGCDTTDGCLICDFLAQGQLPVAFFSEPAVQQIVAPVIPEIPLTKTPSNSLPSHPRAPPDFAFDIS